MADNSPVRNKTGVATILRGIGWEVAGGIVFTGLTILNGIEEGFHQDDRGFIINIASLVVGASWIGMAAHRFAKALISIAEQNGGQE